MPLAYIGRKAVVLTKLVLNILPIAGDKHDPASHIGIRIYNKNERRLIEHLVKHPFYSIDNEESLGIKIKYHDTTLFQLRLCLKDALFCINIMVQSGIGHCSCCMRV